MRKHFQTILGDDQIGQIRQFAKFVRESQQFILARVEALQVSQVAEFLEIWRGTKNRFFKTCWLLLTQRILRTHHFQGNKKKSGTWPFSVPHKTPPPYFQKYTLSKTYPRKSFEIIAINIQFLQATQLADFRRLRKRKKRAVTIHTVHSGRQNNTGTAKFFKSLTYQRFDLIASDVESA